MQDTITALIAETLLIDTASFSNDTPLLGAIPEFDSIGVVMILTALESQFGIAIADDEIDASVFETLGALTEFVEAHAKH